MSEYCVVVAEGAYARIFTLEPAEVPELQSGPNLVEWKAMKDGRTAASNSSRRGRNRSAFGAGHGYDAHREGHHREGHRKFARALAGEVDRLVRGNGFQHLVVCADKRTMGTLRPSLGDSLGDGVQLHEVAKDLANLNCRELHDKLAGEGHLPRRRGRQA